MFLVGVGVEVCLQSQVLLTRDTSLGCVSDRWINTLNGPTQFSIVPLQAVSLCSDEDNGWKFVVISRIFYISFSFFFFFLKLWWIYPALLSPSIPSPTMYISSCAFVILTLTKYIIMTSVSYFSLCFFLLLYLLGIFLPCWNLVIIILYYVQKLNFFS